MKYTLLYIVVTLFGFQTFQTYSNDSLFFPLAVGNKWFYEAQYTGGGPPYLWTTKITSQSNINGKLFFLIENFVGLPAPAWIRYDENSGFLVRYDSSQASCNYEVRMFKMNSEIGDTIYGQCTWIDKLYCNAQNDTIVFGVNSKSKGFIKTIQPPPVLFINYIFFKKIGLIYWKSVSGNNIPITSTNQIKGCVINGILYGDTTLIGINQISSQNPSTYKLFQNYPNPFNPYTKIKFQIPAPGFVELKVYNSIGEQIRTLVNQYLSAGTFEEDFNAITLPSGVYFYRLTSEYYSLTKSMMLIK